MAMLHLHSVTMLRADSFDVEIDGDVSTNLKYQDRFNVHQISKDTR
jgi:hypothetical protein